MNNLNTASPLFHPAAVDVRFGGWQSSKPFLALPGAIEHVDFGYSTLPLRTTRCH